MSGNAFGFYFGGYFGGYYGDVLPPEVIVELKRIGVDLRQWPRLTNDETRSIASVLKFMIQERGNDISEFQNLPNIFVRGRKVSKVPVDSNDIEATDLEGDINYSGNTMWVCVNEGGLLKWKRITLASF